jgi:hypothetical protein
VAARQPGRVLVGALNPPKSKHQYWETGKTESLKPALTPSPPFQRFEYPVPLFPQPLERSRPRTRAARVLWYPPILGAMTHMRTGDRLRSPVPICESTTVRRAKAPAVYAECSARSQRLQLLRLLGKDCGSASGTARPDRGNAASRTARLPPLWPLARPPATSLVYPERRSPVLSMLLAIRLLSAGRDAEFAPRRGLADKFPDSLPGGLVEHVGYFATVEQKT